MLYARPRRNIRLIGLEGVLKLRKKLTEAELALEQSLQAMRTHGHQGVTWELLKADALRVKALRKQGEVSK